MHIFLIMDINQNVSSVRRILTNMLYAVQPFLTDKHAGNGNRCRQRYRPLSIWGLSVSGWNVTFCLACLKHGALVIHLQEEYMPC